MCGRSVCALMLGLIFASTPAQAGMFATEEALQAADELAQGSMFASTGYLHILGASDGLDHWGSAVLIDPHFALVAGHELSSGVSYTGLQFGLGSNIFTDPGEMRTVTATYIYPDYPGGGAWGGSLNDIGLVYFADPILDYTPVTRRTDPSLDLVNEHVWMAGFGDPGTYSDGILPADGQKLAGENIANRIGWGSHGVGSNYLIAEFGPARGTSSLPFEISRYPRR